MDNVITIAVAGLGSRGNAYSYALEQLGDRVKIVACADILPDRVERYGDKYSIPCEMRFSSAEEMLAGERLADVAIIATPDRRPYREATAATPASSETSFQ